MEECCYDIFPRRAENCDAIFSPIRHDLRKYPDSIVDSVLTDIDGPVISAKACTRRSLLFFGCPRDPLPMTVAIIIVLLFPWAGPVRQHGGSRKHKIDDRCFKV